MDFFEVQARAHRRTKWLMVWFGVAALATVGVGYVVGKKLLIWILVSDLLPTDSRAVRIGALAWFDVAAWLTLGVVVWACLRRWLELRQGGAAVADWVGALQISPDSRERPYRRLLNVVEEMAIASCLPIPSVYVMPGEPGINAFAAGFSPNDAVIVVTSGALRRLQRDELQGVIAHEFSHILNGDMRLNLRVAALLHGLMFVTVAGHETLARLRPDGLTSESAIAKRIQDTLGALPPATLLMVFGFPGYFFGRVLQGAVSRQREVLADAAAVQFTRNPAGIIGALRKIDRLALRSHLQVDKAMLIGHVFFAQGFRWQLGGLWATHPSLHARLRALTPEWDSELMAKLGTQDPDDSPLAAAQEVADQLFTADADVREAAGRPMVAFKPAAVIEDIGALTDIHFLKTQALVRLIAPALREATTDRRRAPALIYGLTLAGGRHERDRQIELVTRHAGPAAAAELEAQRTALSLLDPAARLPLVQLCAPALRLLDQAELDAFLTTLDALVHIDAEVTAYEFALQKMLIHHLRLHRPAATDAGGRPDATTSTAVVLSTAARIGSADEQQVSQAFAAGAEKMPHLKEALALLAPDACTLEQLDAALDALAEMSFAAKKELLIATAHVIGHDREVTLEEGEFFRAIAAALDCPVPPLSGS